MSERDSGDSKRRLLEGVIPELLKRAVELGVEKATEAPDSLKALVGDLKVPKELAHLLLSQVEDTKNGLFRVVAKEIRDFLEHTNVAGEIKKTLTTVQFEINTTIRFTPNESTGPESPPKEGPDGQATTKPEIKTDVQIKREERPRERRRSRE